MSTGTYTSTLPSGVASSHQSPNVAATTATSITLDANQVQTMTEVRAAIDALDVQIVTLLGTRMRFIEAAARIKQTRESVRDEARKADVINKAVETAKRVEFPINICKDVYEALVEGCIAREGVVWDERRGYKSDVCGNKEVNGDV